MYLTLFDIGAIMIALAVSIFLIGITTYANHKLQESRKYWRDQYHDLKSEYQSW